MDRARYGDRWGWMIDDDDDDLARTQRDVGRAAEEAHLLVCAVEERNRDHATGVRRINRRNSIDDRLHMNRLLIVQRAQAGIDLDKDVEEAIGREVYPRLLLGDLTR